MRKLIRHRIIKLRSQSKWIVRIFTLTGIIFGFIFAFTGHPIGGTNAENVSNITSSYIHEKTVNGVNTISICDPSSNGTKCITMQDKNLGASEAGTGTSSYGYHFQWGNNHGFEIGCFTNGCTDTVTNSATSTLAIWSGAYNHVGYNGTLFIKGTSSSQYDYWSDNTPSNHNGLRGGENDTAENNYGFDETNNVATNVANRRGPCGDGYHVPSIGEWNQVLEYWAEENEIELKDGWGLKYSYELNGLKFQEDFKIPFAGYRDNGAKVYVIGDYASLWSSSPYAGYEYARYFNFARNIAYANHNDYRANAFSVRCFKDSYLSFPRCPEGQHQVTGDVCVYDDKDIVIQVTATENSTKKIRINKYFANNYTIDWGDGLGGEATSTNDHTYSTPGVYTIILSLSGVDRWTFQSSYVALITKNSYTTVTGVLIKYMPSLASGFGTSDIGVGDNFFRYFNYNGAITSLPDGSFDTSSIESVGNYFFYYFNNGGAITGLPDGSFNISNIESAGNYFFSNFNQNGAITYLPNSFTLNSTGATKSNGYKNAFNSPNYTINRNVSDLVADISTPSSDMDTFSDNQPGRCGAPSNWLVNVPTQCPSTITITAAPASYGTVDSGSVLADYGTQITLSGNTVIIGNTTITATPKNGDYEFSGRDNSCGNTLTTGCNIVARFRSISVGINYTVTFNSDGGNYTPNSQSVEYGLTATKPSPDPEKVGYIFKGWYESGANEPFDFDTAIIEDIDLYARWETSKDILIQVTATGTSNKTIRINKYFGNSCIVDWGDGTSKGTISSSYVSHTYSTPGTYTITLSLTGGAERWTFQSTYAALIPKNGTTVTGVLIKYMTSLASGFGPSDTGVGNYYFYYFNYNGAITGLPDGSFDTSSIESVGNNFFSYFNYNGLITDLPDGSFDISNIESVGTNFFYYFNYGGAITGLPDGSFDTSNIGSAGTYFFTYFNQNGAITYLPNSFKLNSTGATKSNGYKNAFNSPNYTINRDVSDLVANIDIPSSDMDVFSDNQPGRCGVNSYWLQSISNACSIIYDYNGGNAVRTTGRYNANTTEVVAGSDVTEPINSGFVFSGWYTATVGGENITTVYFPSMDGDILYAQRTCGAGYQLENGVCINLVCEEGYHLEGGECIGNTKRVSCTESGEIPSNSIYNIQNVIVTYNTGSDTRNIPANCNWMCDTGYHTENGEVCISNTKEEQCIQSGSIPNNSSYTLGNVQATWNGTWNNGSWNVPNCSWSCNANFHTENGEICISNAKTTGCAESGAPNYASYIPGNVQATWNGMWNNGSWDVPNCAWSCNNWTIQIGNDNCILITTGTAPNYIDTEGESFDMGSLTISDGTDTITILDRNLGATETGTSCSTYNTGACGYFFQWGNNYGFSNPLASTDTIQVDTSSYSRSNPYVSGTFIQGDADWSQARNNNLWGGSGDTTSLQTNPGYMRQGPCPEGYHVPTYNELDILRRLSGSSGNLASTEFYIPFAGRRLYNTTMEYINSYVYFRSSSPYSSYAYNFDINFNDIAMVDYNRRSYALSLRCVRDSDNITTSILSFNTKGGQLMQSQTVPTGGTGHTPGYEPNKSGELSFGGRCKDEDCLESFDFQTDLITGDTTIYAKWICPEGYYTLDGEICLDIASLSCEEGQHIESGACIGNTKQMSCIQTGEIPENSIYNVQNVTVTYNTGTDMWNIPDNCSWMCDTGYHTENNESCVSNTKQEQCTQSGAPSNANYITGNVRVAWSGTWNTGNWTQADNCSWMCDAGYHTQDGETCVENTSSSCEEGQHVENGVCTGNTKQMLCTQSGEIPDNSIYNVQSVTGTWNTGTNSWDAPVCSWMCDTGYHLENNELCTGNTKEVSCREVGSIPANSHYVVGNVEVTWNGTWNNGSWSQAASCTWSCNVGWAQVSSNKCISITTGTAPNYIDTEGNSFDMGSLTISDGTDTITILDRNLGATEIGTSCSTYNTGACGYFFQRGNNYGFSSPLTKTNGTQVNTSNNSWSNPYVSGTFIQGNSDWSLSKNDNLWGGLGDTTSSQTNPDYMRQGPCPEGYHVPKYSELNMLKTLAGNSGDFVNTNLYVPFAGYSNHYGSFTNLNSYAYLWSSSPYSANARYAQIYSSSTISLALYSRARALSLRCVRDSDNIPTSTLSFNTMGGQLMQGQTVPTGGTGHTPGYGPTKTGNLVLSGWYKDEYYAEPFDFQTDIITGDTVIFAQYKCAEGWHMETGECVENERQMLCTESGVIPANSIYNVQNVTVMYDTGTETWNTPDNCSWMCNTGFHTENNESCTGNTKEVSCREVGSIPANSHYVIGDVEVTWNGTWNNGSWSQAANCAWSCNDGTFQIGNNKCLLITTGTAPNYIDTEGNSFDMGSLTISDGTNTITILDRNLGATETGTLCSDYNTGACGYFFQRGNNYGFSSPLTNTSGTQVDTTNNSWMSPYVSDTFIQGSIDWSSNKNGNLWGGSGDSTVFWTNPGYMRQGPCPEGYHVPAYGELNLLKTLAGNSGNIWNIGFYIPLAGYRNHYASLDYFDSRAYLWSSTPNSTNARYAYFSLNNNISTALYYRSYALSLRCVLDSDNTPTSILSFNTRGGQLMQSQTVPTGGTGHTPGYDPKMEGNFEFGGWCKDEDCIESFDFQTDVITGDTIIYARWICSPGYELDQNGDCKKSNVQVTFVANPSTFSDGEFSGGVTSKTLEYFFTTGGYYAAKTEEIQIPQKPHEHDSSGNLLTGWMFEGWYLDTGYSAASRWTGLSANTTYTGITLYARYLPFKDKTVTMDGVTFTIMDRNLGALDYSSGYSYGAGNEQSNNNKNGLFFQRGNNFGFPNIGAPKNILSGILIENFTNKEWGPGNYYFNGTFISRSNSSYNWSSENNGNLWGGNNIGNSDTNKQGPCPNGYHIPSSNEWLATELLFNKRAITEQGNMYCSIIDNGSHTDAYYCMPAALGLPFAGSLYHTSGSRVSIGTHGFYSSSNIYSTSYLYGLYFYRNYINSQSNEGRQSSAYTLRCFKDTTGVTLSYDTIGGNTISGSTERRWFAKDTAPANPSRTGYIFSGWYRDTGYTDEFIFSGDTYISEDTILYAKWIDTTPPTVSISSDGSGSCNLPGTLYTVTGIFSEAVTGVDETDLTVTNGSVQSFNIVSDTEAVWTVKSNTSGYGTVTVVFAADKATDLAGNANTEASNIISRNYDGAGPTSPTLSSPANNGWVKTLKPTLSWNNPGGVGCNTTRGGYEIWVCTDSACNTAVYTNTYTSNTRTWTLTSNLTDGTKYYWKVRAKDGLGNWGNWSTIRSFTVDVTPPTVSISSNWGGTCTTGKIYTVTGTFSEAVNVGIGTLSVTNGLVQSFQKISNTEAVWTVNNGFVYEIETGGVNTFTVCDPNNKGNCITMMDRNMGASKAGTICSSTDTGACGNHYQWGNNHGFDPLTAPTLGTTQVTDCNAYLPSTYNVGTFIKGFTDWCNPRNDNLWGGSGDEEDNYYGYDTGTNSVINAELRQGPCPEGYHVPSQGEWSKLIEYWAANYTGVGNSLVVTGASQLNYFNGNTAAASQFKEDFKIPFAGAHDTTASVVEIGLFTYFWSSSPYVGPVGNDIAREFYFDTDEAAVNGGAYRGNALSVRCFKNSNLSFSFSDYGTMEVTIDTGAFTDLAGNANTIASNTISREYDEAGPTPPTLSTPTNSGWVNTLTPTLTWNNDAGGVGCDTTIGGYEIRVCTDSECNTAAQSNIIDLNTSTWTLTSNLAEGTYYWKVRAKDGLGNWGDWSSVSSFTVDVSSPTFTFANNSGAECTAGGLSITNASDNNGVGLASSAYKFGDGSWGTETSISIAPQQPGSVTVTGYVRDSLGNQSEQTATYAFNNITPTANNFDVNNVGTGITVNWKALSSATEGNCGSGSLTAVLKTNASSSMGVCTVNVDNISFAAAQGSDGTATCVITIKDNENSETDITVTWNGVSRPIPQISFVDPTPVQDSVITQNRFTTKMNIGNIDYIKNFEYEYNGTKYDLMSGLVLMYNFDNVESLGESSTVVKDLSNNGYDGTVHGATWTSNGAHGGAYSFDGVDDYIDLPDYDANDTLKINGTISARIKRANQVRGIVLGSYNSLCIGFYNGNLVGVSEPLINPLGKINNYDFNRWNHVVITAKNGVITYYLNGNELTTEGGDYWHWTDGFSRIGNKISENGITADYKGEIDEIRIYNRALSSDEIQFLYKSNISKTSEDTWEFETLNTCLDASGTYNVVGSVESFVDTSGSVSRTLTTNIPLVSVDGTGYNFGTYVTTGSSYVLSGTMGTLTVTDKLGNSGWLLYLATSDTLKGQSTNESISTNNLKFKANNLVYNGMYEGYDNTHVIFGNGISTSEYRTAHTSACPATNQNCPANNAKILEYIKRTVDPNDFMCGDVGTYSDNTSIQLEVPAWQIEDEYEGVLWITLQDEYGVRQWGSGGTIN